MTPDQLKKYGEDMIEQGQLAEFHQKRENWTMYDYHNNKYQEMMRIYHEHKKKQENATSKGS